MSKQTVMNQEVAYYSVEETDFISLMDIARHKDKNRTDYIIQNWLRNRNTPCKFSTRSRICLNPTCPV